MYNVPAGYAPYTDTRRVDLKFSFGVVAPDAATLAQPRSSTQSVVSQIAQTHDEVEEMSGKYTSLEQNMCLLDGSYSFYPDDVDPYQTGWQSSFISNENGLYSSAPYLEFSFAQPQDSFGFTLVFDNTQMQNYPKEILTTTYNSSGQQLGQITTYPNNWLHIVDLPTQQYSKVRFDFLASNLPYRRVRICEVRFGIFYNYDRNSLVSMTIRQAISPWCENLPSSEVETTINNQDQLYNMVNPSGLYSYLQDGQYMDYSIIINGIEIPMGRQYFTSAESEDGGLTSDITFNDWLYTLDNIEYNAGTSGTWTLSEAIASVLSVAGESQQVLFESGLADIVIRKCIPQKTSCREAVRLCAQAAMCTCFVDRNNKLHFIRPVLNDELSDEWARDVQRNDAQIKIAPFYNTVKLTRRDEYQEESEEEIFTAQNVASGDIERTYEIENDLANDGNAVAEWLLSWVQRRVSYDVNYRGNPALDLLDTVKIDDVYGVNGNALLIEQTVSFDGGLEVNASALR